MSLDPDGPPLATDLSFRGAAAETGAGAMPGAGGADPAIPQRSLPLWRLLLYSFLTTLILLTGAELTLRLLYPIVRSASLPNDMIRQHLDRTAFQYDPDLYWYWGQIPDPGIDLNAFGFRRIKQMTLEKPPGRVRVVALGDSQTLGAGVETEQSYSAMAETALGEGWEVLNAGLSGYRTLNIYRLLQKRIRVFEPDILVVDCMPFDSPRDDGPLVGRPFETRTQVVQRWVADSLLVRHLSLLIERLRPPRHRWMNQNPANLRPIDGEGNHEQILEWARKHHAQVVFMEYAIWDPEARRVGCMTRPGDLPDGATIFPTCKLLQSSGHTVDELFQDHNHLTVLGNRLVGEALAETLRPLRPAR